MYNAIGNYVSIGRLVVGLLSLLVAGQAHAAIGFIASSKVEGGAVYSEVNLQLRCNVHYVDHDPAARGDVVRIRIEPTTVCAGAPPTVALSRQLHRPLAAQDAWIDSVEYDGQSPGNEYLQITFTDEVRFDLRIDDGRNRIVVRVFPPEARQPLSAIASESGRDTSQRVQHDSEAPPKYVINLESSQKRPSPAELPNVQMSAAQKIFVAEATIDGTSWYRVRVGYFDTAEAAARELRQLRERFPGAWIGLAGDEDELADVAAVQKPVPQESEPAAGDTANIAALMADGKRAMTAGELSRAVQIYTKVLQQPASEYHQQAQEYLALARERNGQIAHAKAEYQRYLQQYPDGENAERVQQRLAALLATGSSATTGTAAAGGAARAVQASNPWTFRTFLSQYYRRDVNQVNDQDEIVNQSSVYTDVSVDARRRGERFDLATRVTAGYRSDLLSDDERSSNGKDLRVSYAYADLTDARTGLRGRIGRQTRNTGGVLGRFDGLNLTYTLNEDVRFEGVVGQPVFSTSRDEPDSRTFYGVNRGPYRPSRRRYGTTLFWRHAFLMGHSQL